MNCAAVRRLSLVVVLLFAQHAYAQSASPTFPNPGKVSMSKDQQRSLGFEVASEVYKTMPVLPDNSPESQYVRHLGEKLVATIPKENSWPFEFHVVPQKEINAFALPGGQMFVNVGTITAAKNEAELAGVMGHEMAHVYMQHSAKQASKGQKTGVIAGIASAVLGGTVGGKAGGLVGQLGQMGIQMGAQGLMMKYSRSDEPQADAVGTVILSKAGYNPQGMVDFFKTMGGESKSAPPEFFSSHPNPQNRQEAIQKQISTWPKQTYTVDNSEFDKVHQHATQVKVYSAEEIAKGAKSGEWAAMNQENGASLNSKGSSAFPTAAAAASTAAPTPVALENVLPSDRMVQADLGPMKIQHPENWQVTFPQQAGQFVTIAPKSGITSNGVGYGVLFNGAGAAHGPRANIDEMTNALIKDIQQTNELQSVGKPEPITVGGIEGRSTFFQSPSPFLDADGKPRKEKDWLVTVPRSDGSMIFMIFVALEADFARFQPSYEAMLKTAQFK